MAKNVIYFDSFEIEHIPKEIKKLIGKMTSSEIVIEYKHMIHFVEIFVDNIWKHLLIYKCFPLIYKSSALTA